MTIENQVQNAILNTHKAVMSKSIPVMGSYRLYLKSHGEYPDWEAEVDAFSKDEALDKFNNKYDLGLPDDVLLNNIQEI